MSGFCLGCMKPKAGNPVCEHCGFDERQGNLSHQLPLGTVLQNQYLVGKVLGQGGFGITYMGWDRNLSVPVAIKEYYPGGVVQRNTQWGTDVSCANGKSAEAYGRYRDRFLKEARTLAQLARIPEIVQIRSYFQENNTAYIVMEYVQGITLKSCLNNLGRPMTEAEALEIMQPVLKALQKIHHCGVIHRDISPDNIMIHNSGIKLIDFGTVRYIDDNGHSQSTEAILKPGFAPMEQYNTRGNLGTWTDVYAICASFHYLLTGKVPPDVHERLDEGEELTLLRNRGEISGNTVKALEKGMRIRYQERLQTVDELYSLLYAPKPQKPQKQPKKAAPAQKAAPKKRRKGIGAIAVAAVAVAAACALILQPKQTKTEPGLIAPEPVVSEETERNTPEAIAYAEAEQLLAKGETGKAAIAFGKLGDYQDARARSFRLWRELTPNQTVCGAYHITAALQENGTVLFAGSGDARQMAAKKWTDIISVSISSNHSVGLKADGTVVAAGANFLGQCDVSQWKDIIAICAPGHTVGLRSDGTVVAIGYNENEACNVSDWKDIVAISASNHTVGLKMDGTVVTVGAKDFDKGQLKVEDWTDIIAISAGNAHTVGLKSDGTVVAVGDDWGYGVGECVTDVEGWSDIVAITAGSGFTAGLKSDGTVVFAGFDFDRNYKVSEWSDIVSISAGCYQLFGQKADGTLVATGFNKGRGELNVTNWTDIKLPAPNYLNLEKTETNPEAPSVDMQAHYDAAENLLAQGETAKAAIAFGKLGDYQDARERSFVLWREIVPSQVIYSGFNSAAAVRKDGNVLLSGYADSRQRQCLEWTDIVSISTTASQQAGHTIGLREDGTVVAVGANQWGQCDISSWSDIVAIDTSGLDTVGLTSDGTVLYTGRPYTNTETDKIQKLSSWKDIIAISTSWNTIFGLKADGTVVVAAFSNYSNVGELVKDWSDIIAVSANDTHVVGLKADGTVVDTDNNSHILQWSDIVAVAAGNGFTMGLKSDGTVVATGLCDGMPLDLSGWSDIVTISANSNYAIGVKNDGSIVCVGTAKDDAFIKSWTDIKLPN